MLKKNLTIWYLDILGSNLTYLDAIFNLDHKRKVRALGLNWQIAKYYKDPMKECKMRCKTKSKGVNMNIYTMTLSKISSTKNNHHSPCPIHLINPKLYAKWVFMKIKYFKNILKVCELQGREKRTYAYMHCTCEQILDYTNNPANVFTLIFYFFSRSLWNFRFSRIRPRYPILLFGPNNKCV